MPTEVGLKHRGEHEAVDNQCFGHCRHVHQRRGMDLATASPSTPLVAAC
jgi:hypothetical protein